MTLVLRLSACLLAAAALAACNKSGPAASASTTDASTTAPAASESPAPDAQAPATPAAADDDAHVTLDMGKVKAWMQAQKNLAAVEKADSTLDAAQNISEENTAQYAARLEASPKMHAAIASAGLSTREFSNIGDTLIGALMTEGALKTGQLKSVPDGIDPASVEFVKQHEAEINAMMTGAGAG